MGSRVEVVSCIGLFRVSDIVTFDLFLSITEYKKIAAVDCSLAASLVITMVQAYFSGLNPLFLGNFIEKRLSKIILQ